MHRQDVTRESFARALRKLRKSLTQKRLSRRVDAFRDLGFGRLLESQISDLEHGKSMPAVGTLVNFLAACSDDGQTVDFAELQAALVSVAGEASTYQLGPESRRFQKRHVEVLRRMISEKGGSTDLLAEIGREDGEDLSYEILFAILEAIDVDVSDYFFELTQPEGDE